MLIFQISLLIFRRHADFDAEYHNAVICRLFISLLYAVAAATSCFTLISLRAMLSIRYCRHVARRY